VISYTGITKTRISSPFSAPQLPSSENKAPLTVEHPELAACWPSALGEDLSRAVTVTSEICDPRVSTLFDIGNAVDNERGDAAGGNIPIAVVATGECRNSISFRLLEEDTVELTPLSSETSHRVRVPSVGDAESTEWCPGGAPVRQISFARTVEESPTWVAARFPLSTVVLRPLFHKSRVPMQVGLHDSHITPPRTRNSRLDANPLVEISSSQTGGSPHADVTFNPWYQKQLGIVDERGNWSIWELSGRRRRNTGNWNKACIKSGSLPWAELGGSPGLDDYPRHDGWAAIEWAGGATSFVVADRRCLTLYRMEGDHVWPYSVDLGLNRKFEWILDIKRSHCDASHVFVLTTSRILWLDVSPVIQAPDDQEKRSPLAPRLSWLHFRDPEDTTMRLNSLLIGEGMCSTSSLYSC
jgi:RNA polymerase I-specific transcription initiation factor RRN6